ncbi:MAG: Ig-like domain-containing protein [Oscillospiraceae bacterium]|nr:Ig-like domain-containing protein [Oscillospiraceae bacterium]
MICRQCGSECAASSRFCGVCGAPLPKEAVPEDSGAAKKPTKKKRKMLSLLQWIAIGTAALAIGIVLFLLLRGTPAEAIRLTQNELLIKTEQTVQLTYRLTPEDADDKVRWSTSDERIATVENGLLTAVAEGDCVITALADSGCKDLCYVRVLPPLQPQEKEAAGYRKLYASTQDGKVTYCYGSSYTLSLYSDLTGHLYCPDGSWWLTWSYSHTEGPRYVFEAELSNGDTATITYDADTGHSMHGVVTVLLENGTLWTFQ